MQDARFWNPILQLAFPSPLPAEGSLLDGHLPGLQQNTVKKQRQQKESLSAAAVFETSSVTSRLYWDYLPTNPKSILQICCPLRYLKNKPSPRLTWLQGNFKWYSAELLACSQFSPIIPKLRVLESLHFLKTVDLPSNTRASTADVVLITLIPVQQELLQRNHLLALAHNNHSSRDCNQYLVQGQGESSSGTLEKESEP